MYCKNFKNHLVLFAFLLVSGLVVTFSQAQAEDYRGWEYLVEKLKTHGVKEELLRKVYQDPRMPEFTAVPFGLKPKESHHLYKGFTKKSKIALAQEFLQTNAEIFNEAERRYGVSRRVIAAIMLIESQFGRVTGRELVINRLSRLGAASSPENILENFERLRKDDRSITLVAVEQRARYLDETFFPELPAFFSLVEKTGIDPLEFYGSSAGAFGIPQFLPSAYIRHAESYEPSRAPSLFAVDDAAVSIANFLRQNGWRDNLPLKEKRKVLWQYNRSDAYIQAVLNVSEKLKIPVVKTPQVVSVAKVKTAKEKKVTTSRKVKPNHKPTFRPQQRDNGLKPVSFNGL